MSGKIVRTSNVTQSAVGNKDGLWTTVFAAAIFINEDNLAVEVGKSERDPGSGNEHAPRTYEVSTLIMFLGTIRARALSPPLQMSHRRYSHSRYVRSKPPMYSIESPQCSWSSFEICWQKEASLNSRHPKYMLSSYCIHKNIC
jgi:hypothetical protein